MYLGLNQESTPFINALFTKTGSKAGLTLRSEIQEKLEVPRCRLNVCRGNIKYRGPVTYNQIEGHIRTAKTFRNFKKRLKRENVFKTEF